ncbi:MAG: serine/threonine protein kinase, partial [Blastocatellia bacterium]
MTAERWNQVKRVFELAIERDPEERSAFLHDVCKGDEDLWSEVESLLLAHEDAGSFLERAIEGGGLLGEMVPHVTAGRRIGAYSIVREIGRGGMGSVYLGARADDQFHKQVAIKLVRGGMDSEFVVQRFRTERQILANLDHPNIGRLLDGGATDDGMPYFVMEYIEGKPIDEFCDDNDLTIAERLELFRVVCSAVLYAHQNLVVHRDIKPSNVLVDSAAVPKLLDFGIAKILDPTQAGPETGTALGLMTPDFASPEQVRGEPITTSSDIYSLGVVLYVLLTGQRPYAIKNLLPEEIIRVVCQEEPPKPST